MTGNRDKNVYILGAGFSTLAGAPVMDTFIDKAKRYAYMSNSPLNEDLTADFLAVLDYLEKLSAVRHTIKIDLDNIEELFGILEMESGIDEKLETTRKQLIYMIIGTLELSIYDFVTDREGINASKNNYKDFISMIRKSDYKDTIITFNYDLLFENIVLQYDGTNCNYLIPGIVPGRIKYIKLHGSANWLSCPKCKAEEIKVADATLGIRRILELRTAKCNNCGEPKEPLLVPPTWNKSKYQEPIGKLWRHAIRELSEANRIIIIGYSLPETDTFFKYLLTVAIHRNKFLEKIIIINKSEETKDRYLQFFDDFYIQRNKLLYTGLYFQNFMSGDLSGTAIDYITEPVNWIGDLCNRKV